MMGEFLILKKKKYFLLYQPASKPKAYRTLFFLSGHVIGDAGRDNSISRYPKRQYELDDTRARKYKS